MSRRLSVLLFVAVGCGRKPEPPAPGAPPPTRGPAATFAADEQGLAALLAALRNRSDAEVAALARDFMPTREDFRKILNEEWDARVSETMGGIWDGVRAKSDKELIQEWRFKKEADPPRIFQATTEDLAQQTEAGRRFSPPLQNVARKGLKPRLTFYRVRVEGKGACEMFFHDGSRWVYTGHLEWYVR